MPRLNGGQHIKGYQLGAVVSRQANQLTPAGNDHCAVAGMVSDIWGNSLTLSSGALACSNLDFVWWQNLYNAFGFTGHLNPHT